MGLSGWELHGISILMFSKRINRDMGFRCKLGSTGLGGKRLEAARMRLAGSTRWYAREQRATGRVGSCDDGYGVE